MKEATCTRHSFAYGYTVIGTVLETTAFNSQVNFFR